MNFSIFPRDKYGVIPSVTVGRVTVVWSWPRGPMLWFMWGWGGGTYRIGPVTIII
jgi:hypothetical protein